MSTENPKKVKKPVKISLDKLVESCTNDSFGMINRKIGLCKLRPNENCVIAILKNVNLTDANRTSLMNKICNKRSTVLKIPITNDLIEPYLKLGRIKPKLTSGSTRRSWRSRYKRLINFDIDNITYDKTVVDIICKNECYNLIMNAIDKNAQFDLNNLCDLLEKSFDDDRLIDYILNTCKVVPDIKCLQFACKLSKQTYYNIMRVNPNLQPDLICLQNACKLYHCTIKMINDIITRGNGILPDEESFIAICSKTAWYNEKILRLYDIFKSYGVNPTIKCLYEACKNRNNELVIKIMDDGIMPDKECLLLACGVNSNNEIIEKMLDNGVQPDGDCLRELCKTRGNRKSLERIVKMVPFDEECLLLAYGGKN